MTVSRVINDVPTVRPDRRKRVESAIRELDYAPNLAARTLAGAAVIRIEVNRGQPVGVAVGAASIAAASGSAIAITTPGK